MSVVRYGKTWKGILLITFVLCFTIFYVSYKKLNRVIIGEFSIQDFNERDFYLKSNVYHITLIWNSTSQRFEGSGSIIEDWEGNYTEGGYMILPPVIFKLNQTGDP